MHAKMKANLLIQFVVLVGIVCELVLANEFMTSCLDGHNKLRKKHGVEPVEQDDYLVRYAQWRADTMAYDNKMKHLLEPKFGENLFSYTGPTKSCEAMVRAWYNEIKDYNFDDPTFSSETGHFTQVVWKSTTHVGCAHSKGVGTRWVYMACEYDPPGNYDGEYERNVPRKQRATSTR